MQELQLRSHTSVDAAAVFGHSWRDVARVGCAVTDETLLDLLHLAAETHHARLLRDAAPVLQVASVTQVRQLAEQGWRVVLRSDATRRAAGSLLDMLATETIAWRVVYADDVRDDGTRPQLHAQYALIEPWRAAAAIAWRYEPDLRETDPAGDAAWRAGWPTLPAM